MKDLCGCIYLLTQCVRKVAVHLDMWGVVKSAVYRDRPRKLTELKTVRTTFIRNSSQADLKIMFANEIKWVQACIDARGHHFKHLLYVNSDFPNALYVCVYIHVFT
jgi:hypothetical protein